MESGANRRPDVSELATLPFLGLVCVPSRAGGRVQFRSRNDKDFNARYPAIVQALAAMPDETVIDGEIVALD